MEEKKLATTKLIILFSLSSELQVCQILHLPDFFNLLSRNMSLPQVKYEFYKYECAHKLRK